MNAPGSPIEGTNRCRRLVVALMLTGGVALSGPLGAQEPMATEGRAAALEAEADGAHEAYERGHWSHAFDRFARLADGGDRDASRIAILMWRHGPALYGRSFAADPARRAAWLVHASCRDGAACGLVAARR
jgi:hypothetical protein